MTTLKPCATCKATGTSRVMVDDKTYKVVCSRKRCRRFSVGSSQGSADMRWNIGCTTTKGHRMTTAIRKLIAENKERPIAEAPRDGRAILAKGEDGNWYITFWEVSLCGGWSQEWLDRWHNGRAEWWNNNQRNYTHFRPLPDDRLANAFSIILEHVAGAIEDLKDDGGFDARQILEEGIKRAEAEGKKQ